jgi:hypothetical protein
MGRDQRRVVCGVTFSPPVKKDEHGIYYADYPLEGDAREDLRVGWMEVFIQRGIRKGLDYGLSLNCSVDRRAHRPLSEHVCKNTGSTCLCACHDRRTS